MKHWTITIITTRKHIKRFKAFNHSDIADILETTKNALEVKIKLIKI